MDCIEYARMRFEKLFNHDMQQLLHVYPLDAKTKDDTLFWALPKRAPTPAIFDKKDLLHCTFIQSMACLRANLFFVKIPSEKPRSDQFRYDCGEMASQFKAPAFVPNDQKAKEIQSSVDKEEKNKKDDTEEEKKDGELNEQEEEKKETEDDDI